MIEPLSLPPGCLVRRAQLSDRGMIRHLLEAFRREVLPQISRVERLLKGFALLLLLALVIALFANLEFQAVFNLLMAPAIALTLGLIIAYWLTNNDDWLHFWVVEQDGVLIACAKLRNHSRYSLLHDLYVLPEWRAQGVGSYLVTHLAGHATKPLYLTCLPTLVQFYLRLGFTPVAPKSLSPLLQYDLGIPGRFDVVALVLQ
jgi:N-acetylglutamate synthase-like GNAT family acetyltransferase